MPSFLNYEPGQGSSNATDAMRCQEGHPVKYQSPNPNIKAHNKDEKIDMKMNEEECGEVSFLCTF